MLIKFNSTKTFEIDSLTVNEIIDKIKHHLRDKSVDNIVVDRNMIYFDNTIWKWGSNIAYMTNIKKGIIEIDFSEKRVEIRYASFISILTDILLTLVFLLIGIFLNKFLIFGAIMIFIQMAYRLLSTKSRSDDFLNDMTNSIINYKEK